MLNNCIIKKGLVVTGDLVVNGTIYILKSNNSLEKLEQSEDYEEISGTHHNLTIEGDLLLCQYLEGCDLTVHGSTTTLSQFYL